MINEEIKLFIEAEIRTATIDKPVTSTELIQLVRARFAKTLTSRQIRFIVADLREKKSLPIAGLKTDKIGYCWISNLADYKRYEREVSQYWQKVKQTRDLVKANFLNLPKKARLF